MPRKHRIASSTGIYHITMRSVNQHIIFEEDADYQKFLFILSDCKAKFDIDICAYCLMDNHIHLLLHSPWENLSSFFQSVGTRFVRWYNNKYSRSGHLFQERFFSTPVETESQYLATLVYIHNNPVEASACRFPSEYRWSSYNVFYGEKNALVNKEYSFTAAGSSSLLMQYFTSNGNSSDDAFFFEDHRSTRHFIPDEKALSVFKAVTKLSSTSEAVKLPKSTRNQYFRLLSQKGLTHNQIARFMDVSAATVKRALKMPP